MKPVVYHEEALQEIEESIRFYAMHKTGLDLEFQQIILDSEEIISCNPCIGEMISRSNPIRKYPIRRFPFSIHYREFPDLILIISVAHNSRNPGYWLART